MKREQTFARLAGSVSGKIRRDTFGGREHIVVPIVAMVGDIVISAMGSDGRRELVPLSELALTPAAWNGRPLIPIHPEKLEQTNTPAFLERNAVGLIFNTEIKNGKLAMEGWFDAEKAAAIGEENLVERAAAGDVLEVSVGCWIFLDKTPGVTASGERYDAIWRDLIPDHLAVGLDGARGACSADAGCGTRAAKSTQREGGAATMKKGYWNRIVSALASATKRAEREAEPDASGTSDSELRGKLWEALRSSEPAFDWVEAVFAETKTVVYSVSPDGVSAMWSRTFNVGEDGSVELADDAVMVEAKLEFTPVAASEPAAPGDQAKETVTATADCGCKEAKAAGASAESTDQAKEDENMNKLKELVGRLMSSKSLPVELKCETALEALGEERLTALDARHAAIDAPAKPAEAAAGVTTTPDPKPMSREQMLAAFPDVREIVEREAARKKDEREKLLARLARDQKAFTPEQLATKETTELQSLAALLDSVTPEPDYSGKGGTSVSREAASKHEPPNAWGLDADAKPLTAQKGAN